VEEWEVETVEQVEALGPMYHSMPCCTQADVAACSCMWSSHQHRMSTHTPETQHQTHPNWKLQCRWRCLHLNEAHWLLSKAYGEWTCP
jgi:hypothetical protein